jgi:antitoxin StbD
MDALLAEASVGIAELRKNPAAVIRDAGDAPVAILDHNRPSAYLVPAHRFEAMMDVLDDLALAGLVEERLKDIDQAVEVTLDELENAAHAKLSAQVSPRRA